MKTKHVIVAMALPLAFAACTNEDFVTAPQEKAVVGADLIAKGIHVNVAGAKQGDASTRYNEQGWETTDKLGFAWWNNPAAGSGAISDEQGADYTYEGTDYKVYTNHLLNYTETGFKANGDIYAGAYFAYYPFARMQKVDQMTVDYSAFTQTEKVANDAELINLMVENAFHISEKQIVGADAVDADMVLNVNAGLARTVNAFAVTTTLPVENYAGYGDLLDNIKITGVEISISEGEPFKTIAKIKPQELPVAQTKEESGAQVYDKDETLTANKAAVLDALELTASSTIATNLAENIQESVKNANNGILLYTFPTDASVNPAADKITITINTGSGKFVIKKVGGNPTAAQTANNAVIDAIVDKLGADAGKQPFSSIQNLKKLSITLDMADFSPNYDNVATAADWNSLMTLLSASTAITGEKEITITSDITFDAAHPFTLPTRDDVIVKAVTADRKKIIFDADATIAKPFISGVTMEVNAGKTLTVNNTLTIEAITNKGTIVVANEKAIKGSAAIKNITNAGGVIECNGSIIENVKVLNTKGKIIVSTGTSRVTHDKNGYIAGELDGAVITDKNQRLYYIHIMTASFVDGVSTPGAPVACNTLVLKNFGDLKLDDESNVWGQEGAKLTQTKLGSVNLILNNTNLDGDTGMNLGYLRTMGTSVVKGNFVITHSLELAGGKAEDVTITAGRLAFDAESEFNGTITGVKYVEFSANATVTGTITTTGNVSFDNGVTVNLNRATMSAGSVVATNAKVNLSGSTITTISDGNFTLKNGSDVDLKAATGPTAISKLQIAGRIVNNEGGRITKDATSTIAENYVL